MSKISNDPALLDRVENLLSQPESHTFECKRIGGNRIDKILETIVAFSNSSGGVIAIGLEDPDKGTGRDRLFGIQEKIENWDELRRKIKSRITEPEALAIAEEELPCVLQDGKEGSLFALKVQKSSRIHSIVDGGTFVRLEKGNRQITAPEIAEPAFSRGIVSADSHLTDVDLELLETEYWREYAAHRGITSTLPEALLRIGLAKRNTAGITRPTMAAVLLFADFPSGLLAAKAAIRVFHYRGTQPSTDPNTNLIRPPLTVEGPLIRQIRNARQMLVRELGQRIQHTQLGFEIVQKYPVRVLSEAITNAVIHRDYRLPSDIFIRIFADRIEIESPGLLVDPVTPFNIQSIGTFPRNKLIVDHLREFPSPPNLDAGEGVKMMFGTMQEAGLYPPVYRTRPEILREAVVTVLWNQSRPSIWEQVVAYIQKHGSIGNAEVRRILETDNTLAVSKMLKEWVDHGFLIRSNPWSGPKSRRYSLPKPTPD